MSLDAIVWLLVGIGIGVAACLMLLMLYAGLERWRLGRRLRRGRVLRQLPQPRGEAEVERRARLRPPVVGAKAAVEPVLPASAEPAPPPVPDVVPVTTEAAFEPVVTAEVADAPESPDPAVKRAVAEAGPEPASPAPKPAQRFTVIASKPEAVSEENNEGEGEHKAEIKPAAAPAPVPAPAEPRPADATEPTPRPMRSVEELFAEAFALERVAIPPLKSDKDEAG
jgi:hypothetical protein